MPDAHGFEGPFKSRPTLRCSVCGVGGEPWDWTEDARRQHAQMHAGNAVAAEADRELTERRDELAAKARTRPHRDRRKIQDPRRCANPYCSVVFQPKRSSQRYHSDACRVADWRQLNS